MNLRRREIVTQSLIMPDLGGNTPTLSFRRPARAVSLHASLIETQDDGSIAYVKNHRQLADIGPAEEAGDVLLDPPIDRDLEAIKQRGTLTILAPYNSTTYFLLRGEPMGYEYELLQLQAFSLEHGLKLVMEVVKNQKTLYQMLNRGEGDIVAARIIPKQEDEAKVSFTHTLYRTEPGLVQQKKSPDQANLHEAVKSNIKSEPADIKPDEIEINVRLITKPVSASRRDGYVTKEICLPQDTDRTGR